MYHKRASELHNIFFKRETEAEGEAEEEAVGTEVVGAEVWQVSANGISS